MKMIRLVCVVIAFHLMMVGVAMPKSNGATHKVHSEYEVKAAFIYNFMQFVTWPKNALEKDSPLIIRIAGDFHYCKEFESLYCKTNAKGEKTRKKYDGHDIIVKKWGDSAENQNCHVIFVATGAENKLPDIIAAVKDKPVLIILDSDITMDKGSMISFYMDGTRIRFKIDPQAATDKGLKISSHLLSLATIVNSKDDNGGRGK